MAKLRGALQFVTGTYAGWRTGWPGMLWTLIFRMRRTSCQLPRVWLRILDILATV